MAYPDHNARGRRGVGLHQPAALLAQAARPGVCGPPGEKGLIKPNNGKERERSAPPALFGSYRRLAATAASAAVVVVATAATTAAK